MAQDLLPLPFSCRKAHTCLVAVKETLLRELVKPIKDMAEGWVELPWGHIPQLLLFVNLILLIDQVAWSKAVGGWQTNTVKVNARLVGTNA